MNHDETPPGAEARPVGRKIVLAAALLTGVSIAIMLARVPLGEHVHWKQNYAAERYWANIVPAACLLVVFSVLVVWSWGRPRRSPKWLRVAGAAGLVALAAWGYVLTACAGKFHVAEFLSVMTFPAANGSYYCEAERIGPYFAEDRKRKRGLPLFESVGEFLDGYATYVPKEVLPGDTMRVLTHPPGVSLFCYAVQVVFRRFPQFADSLIVLYRSCFRPPPEINPFVMASPVSARIFVASTTTLGLLTIMLASLTAPLAAVGVQRIGQGGSRGVAFGLAALLPSLHLYNPGIDQAFPFFALAFWLVLLAAVQRRSLAAAALSGVVFFLCMGFSLAFMAALAVPIVAAAVGWIGATRKQGYAPRALTTAAFFAAGLLACVLIAWLATGYDTFGAWLRCYRNNRQFNIDSARGYWIWLLYNPILFLLFIGGPVAALWLAGTYAAVRRTWCGHRVDGSDWVPLSVAATIVLLLVSGVNRGEVERLWMFLMPACLIAGLAGLRARFGRGEALALMLMQAAQVAVFRVCYDAWDIARYLSEDFGR